MVTVVYEDDQVRIPDWVVDLESFRRWAETDELPETGHVGYLKGEVRIDISKEQLFSHNQVKTELVHVVGGLVKARKLGHYFTSGLFMTNVTADFSVQPDGTFVSAESWETGRVRPVRGKHGGYSGLEGSPDMVLEVLSRISVHKDTVVLREAYWEAGIREYWLVDARRAPLRFDIFRHTPRGYVATRKQAGWLRSVVFRKSFQLTQQTDALGFPEFTLAVR